MPYEDDESEDEEQETADYEYQKTCLFTDPINENVTSFIYENFIKKVAVPFASLGPEQKI